MTDDTSVVTKDLESSKGIVEAPTEAQLAKIKKKEQIIEYLRRFPFYKWAAKSVAIDEDTLINWRHDDAEFSDRVEIARSEGIRYFGGKATPDLILKSADPQTFKERMDITSDGKKIETNTIIFSNFKNDTKS